MEKAHLFKPENLVDEGIWAAFPGFSAFPKPPSALPSFAFESFPEPPAAYAQGFDFIQKNQRAGNCYLANYTRQTRITTNYSLAEIFHASRAKYKVFFRDEFVCFSPETFVEIRQNRIATHPMKGTINAALPNAESRLRNDVKEKAEHYTVVDLLRNDLSRVASRVCIKEFQRVDRIQTERGELLGMSSEIEGILRPEFQQKIGSILKELLPAGSILGAPKEKTFEITAIAEGKKRGWYTGVCGYFDGENLDSAVMIRFLEKQGMELYFRSGGGITHLSQMTDEYNEMKEKIYVPISRKP